MTLNFLFISEYAESLAVALRIAAEGNDVAMWVSDAEYHNVGNGLIDKVEDLEDIPDDTTIIADVSGFGFLCDMLRSRGFTVVGGATIADKLENDREYAASVMEQAGVKTPRAWDFASFDDAASFAQEHTEIRFVLKPTGALSGAVPSFVSKDTDDLLEELEWYKSEAHGDVEFQLQEFIEGQDLSLEAWFNGREFIEPFNHTFEKKKFANGCLGPSKGCAGNVVWATEPVELFRAFEPLLRKGGYIGPFDLNMLLSQEGEMYGLEFTPRFGYDATPTFFNELFDGDVGRFFFELARNSDSAMQVRDGFAFGVRVTAPPYPSELPKTRAGLRLKDIDLRHFAPYGLMLNDKDEVVTAGGGEGSIGIATGYGETLKRAANAAYRVAEDVSLADKHYRTDLYEVFKECFEAVGFSDEVRSILNVHSAWSAST